MRLIFNLLYRIYFYKFDDIYIYNKSFFYNRCRAEKRGINQYVEISNYLATVIKKSIYRLYRVKRSRVLKRKRVKIEKKIIQ